MSFKSLLKSFSRSTKELPKNLSDEESALPDGKDLPSRLDILFRERRTAVPAFRPTSPQKTIVICLVIVNELRHESVWKEWVASGSGSGVYEGHLFIHAKNPEQITSRWVRERLIAENFRPEWNSTEVVRAMLAVMDHALKHCDAERLIFATESCIPIYDLPNMADILYREEKSWLSARDEAESSWERGRCFEAVDGRIIPRGAVWKALPGWIMLTRRHALDISGLLHHTGGYALNSRHDGITTIDLVRAFGPPGQWHENSNGVFAPEEVFFATMLGLLGYLKPGYERLNEVKSQSISYATWARRGDANPQIIPELNRDQLERMRRTGALMARKFDKNDRLVEQWRRLVLDKSRSHRDIRQDEPVKEVVAIAVKPEAVSSTSGEGKRPREENENHRSDEDKEANIKRQRVEEAVDDGKEEGEE